MHAATAQGVRSLSTRHSIGGSSGRHARRPHRPHPDLWILLPIVSSIVRVPEVLQAPVNVYDGGLLLTLARFTAPTMLPYRDLWTLYGPGPAVLGALTMGAFGRGLVPITLVHLLVDTLLALGVYALARRYTSGFVAGVMGVAVVTFASSPMHFAETLALLVWGLWFILKSSDEAARSKRRLGIGSALIGTAFLGRYEFLVVSPLLVVAMWLWLRPRLGPPAQRIVLLAGLLPPAIFALYLLAVVGWDRAYLNLVQYPFDVYPVCRGIPTPWSKAVGALFAPLRGRVWTGEELVLGVGTYVVPLAAAAAISIGAKGLRARSNEAFVAAALGVIAAFVWLEMRPRAGGVPSPTWPLMLLGLAVCLPRLRRVGRKGQVLISSLILLPVLAVLLISWLPGRLGAWSTWPTYDSKYGFADTRVGGQFDPDVAARITAEVHRYADVGAPIFVALHSNAGHFANAPIWYWVVDRPPVSRFFEFDPCLTDTELIQEEIVRDLVRTNVVITTTHYPQHPPLVGVTGQALDSALTRDFEKRLVVDFPGTPGLFVQQVSVLIRRGAAPSP